MKKISILLILSLTSCFTSEISSRSEKCVILKVKERSRYEGLTPDKNYIIETSCGYSFSVNRKYEIGDSISVDVHSVKK